MKSWCVKSLIVITVLVWGVTVFGQGAQTGTLSGRVSLADGSPLPGVTVSLASDSLQGAQSTVTDVNGVFLFRALPPGQYVATFEMNGLTNIGRAALVPLGGAAVLDTTMALAPVRETVVVTAQVPPALVATQAATNLRKAEIDVLPIDRVPFAIAELAPGVNANTPNASQLSISGGFAYDNVFLVDGVDVNDNVLGTANTLFIEDAIQEVQVLTSGISAEYGRFSGGVVNVITRSGGNDLSGTFRTTLTNPAWIAETPFERDRGIQRTSKLSTAYEGTLGGPIVRDRLWVFGASRFERSEAQSAYAQTGLPYASKTDNTRYEAKLTGTIRPGHTLQGTYIDNQTDLAQPALPFSIDPATYGYPKTPNRLFGANYSGVLASRFFAQLQFSRKTYHIRGVGGTATDIVDSPFLSRTGAQVQYNAPYFDATDPENRDNRQVAGSLSYFLSSPRFGSHDLKGGAERFTSTRVGGNSQTSTGFVFRADYLRNADGTPALDTGWLIPRFVPGVTQMQTWMPQRGATIDINTTSLYLTDRWAAGPHWTLDLGLRYEHARSEATGGISGARTDVVLPRAGASYDLDGDGRTVVQATYAHYSGDHNDVQFARNSNVGNADRVTGVYIGPSGQGRGFAPGFDPANYVTVAGTFPTANVFFADNLHAPITREFTMALGQEIGDRGYVKGIYVRRTTRDLIEDFITIDGGQTTVVRDGVDFGTFDNQIYRNSNLPKRDYQAIELVSTYRRSTRWQISGNWTVQIRNDGNFEGEARNNPAIPSVIGDYPEVLVASRDFPMGRLASFQRHKVRVWGIYTLGFGRFGELNVTPIYRYNSGLTYSLTASVPLSAQQLANDPGYLGLTGARQTIYFGERGAQSFDGYQVMDLSLAYQIPVWRSARPWLKLDVYNLFNNQKLITWDTTIAANTSGPVDQDGLPLDYVKGPSFGTATSASNYPRPRPGVDGGRAFVVAFGVRF